MVLIKWSYMFLQVVIFISLYYADLVVRIVGFSEAFSKH